ncbi:MAG: helix-turn-helix domain-containing protein [Nitrososphaeria archaeon]
MPIKKFDDEILRPKALELRKNGLSYRAIAKELGCSPGKVHDLLAPYESPQNRLKQISELNLKIRELEKRALDFKLFLEQLKNEANHVLRKWTGTRSQKY